MSEGRLTRDDLNPNVLESLRGPQGEPGQQGPPGEQGLPGSDAEVTSENIESALGFVPTELQIATESTLGGIKPDGETITVDPETGLASAVGGGGSSYYGTAIYNTSLGQYEASIEGINELYEGLTVKIKIQGTNTSNGAININNIQRYNIRNGISAGAIRPQTLLDGNVYTIVFGGSIWHLQGSGFSLVNTLNSTSNADAATANAVKQVNDKVEGETLTVPTSILYENVDTARPARIKKVGGIVTVEAFLKVKQTLNNNTILSLPAGYRPRQDFSFRIYRQRGSVYEHLNGIADITSLMLEGGEMSKYAVGDFLRFSVTFAIA